MASVFKHQYTSKTKDGRRVAGKTRKYYIEYKDAQGIRRRVPGYTDKRATEQKAAELERQAARLHVGIIGVHPDHTNAPVTGHIEDWLTDLERTGRSPEYTRKVASRIKKLRAGLKWATLGSIRPDTFSRWLGRQTSGGMGERTANHYLEAAVAFCNWCVAQQRLEENPLKLVGKVSVVEPRCVRRAATLDELKRLLEVAGTRRLVYLTAVLTGLRRKELGLLQWGDVVLDDDVPRLELRAVTTKSKRDDIIPLTPELAEALLSDLSQ